MPTHEEQIAIEAAAQYETLTKRIQALDTDIARTLDHEQLLALQDRRDEMTRQRELLVQSHKGMIDDMEREELKLLYEMRGELAALKSELAQVHMMVDQVRADCMPVGSGISPGMLNVMMIGGLISLCLLIILTVLSLLPG